MRKEIDKTLANIYSAFVRGLDKLISVELKSLEKSHEVNRVSRKSGGFNIESRLNLILEEEKKYMTILVTVRCDEYGMYIVLPPIVRSVNSNRIKDSTENYLELFLTNLKSATTIAFKNSIFYTLMGLGEYDQLSRMYNLVSEAYKEK